MKEWLLFYQEYFEKRSDSKYGNHRTSPSLQKPYITDCLEEKKLRLYKEWRDLYVPSCNKLNLLRW